MSYERPLESMLFKERTPEPLEYIVSYLIVVVVIVIVIVIVLVIVVVLCGCGLIILFWFYYWVLLCFCFFNSQITPLSQPTKHQKFILLHKKTPPIILSCIIVFKDTELPGF